jgi:nicotinate-nucleotide pyrophosphorylase (carboxylating)
MNFDDPQISKIIDFAIEEDIKNGDITTDLIVSSGEKAEAVFTAKQDGIVSGLKVAEKVMQRFDKNIIWKNLKMDGDTCVKSEKIAVVKGTYKALLGGERTALNFLQRMSGIATKTNKFVKQLEGLNTKILDTRKTVPGHRILDKYAVKTGGGTNHRMGLFDMAMIKDNHIKLAGSISNAIAAVKNKMHSSLKIEVETSSVEEVKEALKFNVDFIMLDNMTTPEMKNAVKLCKDKVLTEASGNISLRNIRDIAETGVDFISIGELTHSVEALDISMKIISKG